MKTSSYLGLNLPEGTDVVDLVNQYGPNFTKLDGELSSVNESLAEKSQQADLDKANDKITKNINYVTVKNKTDRTKRKNYLLYDSFARVDSATTLGNAETNNAAYVVLGTSNPIWGISGNQAYFVSQSGTANTVTYQETNESDGIVEVWVNGQGTSAGLAFRVTDVNNFWYFYVGSTTYQFGKWVAGASTIVKQASGNYVNCKISVSMKGNKIEAYIDGILVATTYDTFNNTATKHGFCARSSSIGYRWDNFCVKPNGEIPFNVVDGFEDSTFKWYWSQESAGLSYSLAFNTLIKNSGNQSLRAELNYSDPLSNVGKHRSELRLPSEPPLEEHWYGFSLYLPNGGTEDYGTDSSAEILAQWHASPDSGEDQVSPPLCLQTVNGHYYIIQRWQDARMTVQSGIPTYTQDLGDYSADKGKWVNWVFHVRWGWLSDQEPITEVYKDGQLVFERNGQPNTFNDASGVYPKLGIYKWDWDTMTTDVSKRVVYYDDVWMK